MKRIVLYLLFMLVLSVSSAADAFLFHEDFGWGNEVNGAVPIKANGAENDWYAARFQDGAPGRSISDDVGMSQMASADPKMHGWASDGAALLINLSTLGSYENTLLHFTWRMGYGDGIGLAGLWEGDEDITGFNADRTIDLRTGPYRLNNWSKHFVGPSGDWQQSSFFLTNNKPNIWIAFWMLGGTQDYIRITDIYVDGDPITEPIPEPSTLIFLGTGILGMMGYRNINNKKKA